MDDDYKTIMPEIDIGDNGVPLSKASTATEIVGDGKPKLITTSRSSTDGGASASASSDELAHVGTTWCRHRRRRVDGVACPSARSQGYPRILRRRGRPQRPRSGVFRNRGAPDRRRAASHGARPWAS